MQINDVNVRGMGSEQVASVLRQSGSHVRLIVARGVTDPLPQSHPHAPVIPTTQLDEALQHLFALLVAVDHQDYANAAMLADSHMAQQQLNTAEFMAQIHEVRNDNFNKCRIASFGKCDLRSRCSAVNEQCRVPTESGKSGIIIEGFPVLAKSWNFVTLLKSLENAENPGNKSMYHTLPLFLGVFALHVRGRPNHLEPGIT